MNKSNDSEDSFHFFICTTVAELTIVVLTCSSILYAVEMKAITMACSFSLSDELKVVYDIDY
jgi:hypothetical protein